MFSGLLAWFVLSAAAYSLLVPLWEAPDEPEHFAYIRFLLAEQALPSHLPSIQMSGNQEAKQPPLYYLLAAPLAAGVNLGDADRIRLNPRATWPHDPAGTAMVLHVQDEGWPFHGVFLAAHRVRLLSVLLGAVTVALTFAIAHRLTRSEGAALLAAALTALLPGFVFASATINNDALADTLSAALLLLALRATPREPLAPALGFGVVGAVALLTKLNVIVLIVVGLGALLVRAGPGKRGAALAAGAAPLAPAVLFWAWRIAGGQRDLIGMRVHWPPVLTDGTASAAPSLARFGVDLWTSFFGVFGWQNLPLPSPFYAVYGALFVGGLLGLALRPIKGARLGISPCDELFLLGWVFAVLASMVGSYLTAGSPLGYDHARFLYPALPAVVTLVAAGWSRLASLVPWLRAVAAPALATFGLTTLAIAWLVIRPAYPWIAPITNRTPVGVRPFPQNSFGNRVDLAGVTLPAGSVGAGQAFKLLLYWRVQQPLPNDDWLFVHVVDARGATAAAFDGAPMWNTVPLSSWRAGDVVVDQEVLTIHGNTSSGQYQVYVGWYNPKTGERVPLAAGGNQLAAGAIIVAGT